MLRSRFDSLCGGVYKPFLFYRQASIVEKIIESVFPFDLEYRKQDVALIPQRESLLGCGVILQQDMFYEADAKMHVVPHLDFLLSIQLEFLRGRWEQRLELD